MVLAALCFGWYSKVFRGNSDIGPMLVSGFFAAFGLLAVFKRYEHSEIMAGADGVYLTGASKDGATPWRYVLLGVERKLTDDIFLDADVTVADSRSRQWARVPSTMVRGGAAAVERFLDAAFTWQLAAVNESLDVGETVDFGWYCVAPQGIMVRHGKGVERRDFPLLSGMMSVSNGTATLNLGAGVDAIRRPIGELANFELLVRLMAGRG